MNCSLTFHGSGAVFTGLLTVFKIGELQTQITNYFWSLLLYVCFMCVALVAFSIFAKPQLQPRLPHLHLTWFLKRDKTLPLTSPLTASTVFLVHIISIMDLVNIFSMPLHPSRITNKDFTMKLFRRRCCIILLLLMSGNVQLNSGTFDYAHCDSSANKSIHSGVYLLTFECFCNYKSLGLMHLNTHSLLFKVARLHMFTLQILISLLFLNLA